MIEISKEVEISSDYVKELVSDRLQIDNISAICSVRFSGGDKAYITLQNYYLVDILKGKDMYCLVPKSSTRVEEGKWTHDLSSFKIYKLDKEFLTGNLIDDEFMKTASSRIPFLLKNLNVVYDSEQGIYKENLDIKLKTVSDYDTICVLLRIPEATQPWINNLINRSNNNLNNK